jgi:prepilin-type N-terminal cleavage/methylation domain-containing protein
MKNKAFTLAEVLITLVIVGVVAALTIPNSIKTIKAVQLQSQFKKAYSVLRQAIIMYNEDDNKQTIGSDNAPILQKYFKGATLCTDKDTSSTLFCMARTENGKVTNMDYNYTDYTKTARYVSTWMFDDYQYFLPDGMLINNDANKNADGSFYLSVDVNGKKGKPNALGHDLFVFVLRETEKGVEIIPSGESSTYYADKTKYCNTTPRAGVLNGLGCTYYAITDSEYFKNLPK